jgi:hypothetical protein
MLRKTLGFLGMLNIIMGVCLFLFFVFNTPRELEKAQGVYSSPSTFITPAEAKIIWPIFFFSGLSLMWMAQVLAALNLIASNTSAKDRDITKTD